MNAEIVVIGGGVIGLAVARLAASKGHSVILLEKESGYGTGVSSRNTEVIHAGIYYKTGSLKASLCVRGKHLLYEHCEKYGVRHKRIGKLFLATTDREASKLELICKQASENGVDDVIELDESALRKMEPWIRGKKALFSPSTGILDSHGFMKSIFELAKVSGMIFVPNSPVIGAEHRSAEWSVMVGDDESSSVSCRVVINAAGLHAIELSKKIFPGRKTPTLHPTKGSYMRLSGKSPVTHIIYPALVPGVVEERVDATPDLGGSLRFGPNIEDTDGLEDFSLDPGLVESMTSGIKRYLPDIDIAKLHPDCSGIRPKIYGPEDPVEDFRFEWAENSGWLDLWGIESPGMTASLAIAEHVYGLIRKKGILA